MKRVLQLAEKGYGTTSPNPMVGALVVKGNMTLSEGYHEKPGMPHAEVVALEKAGPRARGATLYVNLEPCCHYGRTPPCVEKIIKTGIKRVVCAMEDPNPLVAGKGFKMLVEAGVEVKKGVLEKEARQLNEAFIKYITTGVPFVTCKYAMTLDGKIATKTGNSRWISGELSRTFVHRLRFGADGILVGVGTVIADDPLLNCRLGGNIDKQPVRIIVDSGLRVPLNARLLRDKGSKTIVVTTEKCNRDYAERLQNLGVEVLIAPVKRDRVDLGWMLKAFGKRQFTSILVEGGSSIITSLVEEGIVDKFIIFIAPKIVGGIGAPTPVGGNGVDRMDQAVLLKDINIRRFEDDVAIIGYIKK